MALTMLSRKNSVMASSLASAMSSGLTSNFSWGLAEEAGRSARYLASIALANNLQSLSLQPLSLQPWTLRPLLNLLANIEGIDYGSLRPRSTSDAVWHAAKPSAKKSLCPIITGCAISDLAGNFASNLAAETTTPQPIILQNLFSPLLLLPFLARASQNHALAFEVSWQGVTIVAKNGRRNGNLVNIDASFEELLTPMAEIVTIAPQRKASADKRASGLDSIEQQGGAAAGGTGGAAAGEAGEAAGGVLVRDEDWQELQAYAARIYVPASEESRLRGAGASSD